MRNTIFSFVSLLFLSSCSIEHVDQMVSIHMDIFLSACKRKSVTMSLSNQNTNHDITIEKATLLYHQNKYSIRSPSLDFPQIFYPLHHYSPDEYKECAIFHVGYLNRDFIISKDYKDYWFAKKSINLGKMLIEFRINNESTTKTAYIKDFLYKGISKILEIDLDSP